MLTLSVGRGCNIQGRQVSSWNIYTSDGVIWTRNHWDLEAKGDDLPRYRNKLVSLTLPAEQTDVRMARKVDFSKGDVFAIRTENGRYTGDTAKCALYIPAHMLGAGKPYERVAMEMDDQRSFSWAVDVQLYGQLEAERFMPEEIAAECDKEDPNWRDSVSGRDWAWRLADRHPSKGWKPGREFKGDRVTLCAGLHHRTDYSERRQALDKLSAEFKEGRQDVGAVLKRLIEEPALLRKLMKAAKANPKI